MERFFLFCWLLCVTNFNQKRVLTDKWSFFFLFFFVNIAVSLYLGFWLLQRYYIIKGGPFLGQNEKQTFISSFIWGHSKTRKTLYGFFFSHINLVALTQTKYPSHGFPCNVVQAVMVNRKRAWWLLNFSTRINFWSFTVTNCNWNWEII